LLVGGTGGAAAVYWRCSALSARASRRHTLTYQFHPNGNRLLGEAKLPCLGQVLDRRCSHSARSDIVLLFGARRSAQANAVGIAEPINIKAPALKQRVG